MRTQRFGTRSFLLLASACGQVASSSGARDAGALSSDATSAPRADALVHPDGSDGSLAHADGPSAPDATPASGLNDCPLPPASIDSGIAIDAPCTGDVTDAGACLLTLASQQQNPTGLALRGDTLVWANSPETTPGNRKASIVRSSTNGGSTVTLASNLSTSIYNAVEVTLDDSNVYWASDGVYSVSLSGGTVATLHYNFDIDTFSPVRAGDSVYFLESQGTFGLFGISTLGAAYTQLSPNFTEAAWAAGSSTGVVYTWATYDETPGGLVSLPCGGAPVTLYSEPSGAIGLVAAAGEVIVFIRGYVGHCDLMAIPLAGGTPRLVAADVYADSVATDGTDVYWTDANENAVMKCNLTSGSPSAIAPYSGTAPFGESSLALDATSLYYVSHVLGVGTILKLTPR